MKTILKNGLVVSGTGVQKKDLLLVGEKIEQVGDNLMMDDARVIDVSGKYLFPGFIDGHTHFDLEVAGTVTADDFESGTRAAIIGGTTMIIDFATQNKGETLTEALEHWHKKADGKCSCDYGFHMAISDWNSKAAQEIPDMIAQGVTSFKLYMTYPAMLLEDGEIYEVLKELNRYHCFAGVHCENASMIDAFIREAKEKGTLTPDMHPKVRPQEMEGEAVHRLVVIAKEAKAPVMVVHVTSRSALWEIQEARKKGQTVYAETCPQYLLLDDQVFAKPGFEGAKYVCSPPMRKKEDQECLWKALAEGEIQTIATDHCSFSMKQKEMGLHDFTKIPNGMPGVETRGNLIYNYGVLKKRITPEQMCRLLSENPAKLYGIYPRKGSLTPGADADIVVIDPHRRDVISAQTQHYAMDYAPYEGFALEESVESVFLRGNLVVSHGEIQMEKQGEYIRRDKNTYGK